MTTHNDEQAPAQAGALPMTAAEFRCLREWLGLTTTWTAQRLGVAERTVHRWEAGVMRVPAGVSDAMLALSEQTYDVMNAAVEQLLDTTDPAIETYRTDADFREHQPQADWPASWHRALAARVADEVPGVRIEFWVAP